LYCAYAILIELLIVIVILGVLAAVIIPNLSRFLGSGTVGAANTELATVRTAIAAYMADNNNALPLTGAANPVNNALLAPYTNGTTIKAAYSLDLTATDPNYGQITAANPGAAADATDWGPTIKWSTTSNDWVKS
jgi:type IV pilus assembly protein PilA